MGAYRVRLTSLRNKYNVTFPWYRLEVQNINYVLLLKIWHAIHIQLVTHISEH